MDLALRPPMTVEQFLAWEQRQELRYEFDGERAIPMLGGTATHANISRNIVVALTGRLRGTACRVFGHTLKISVAGSIRYPDAFVIRNKVPGHTKVVAEPVVVFEVLSPSTSRVDLTDKNREYRDTPSIERYVILHQTHAAAMVFVRHGDWVSEIVSGDGAVLVMPEIGIEIPLAELYTDIDLVDPGLDDA